MMISSASPPLSSSALFPTSSCSKPRNLLVHFPPLLAFRLTHSHPPPATAPGCLRLSSVLQRGPIFLARALFESEVRVEVVPEGFDVEAEIYEFMLRSPNPEMFPTKEELLAAGRADLVNAVSRQGGWLAFGWDVEDDERVFQGRLDGGGAPVEGGSALVDEAAGSSGRSGELEMESSGIEGILNRLEKERSLSLAVGSIGKEDRRDGISLNATVVGSGMSDQLEHLTDIEDLFHDFGDAHFQNGNLSSLNGEKNSHKVGGWRTWSSHRAGSSESEFEAGEIIPFDHGSGNSSVKYPSIEKAAYDEKRSASKLPSDVKQNLQNHIHSRLQQLEKELSSVLKLVRSGSDSVGSDKSQQSSMEELHNLSDSWEFQQTDLMKTRDKLRSTRSKLAVLEGKMAMEIIEAQKVLEEKQKKLNDAKKALHLLQTVCIVWANSASEVLLAGSFDGWASQRKMERSDSGIFFLNLKLYPGRYEIKFIVDGVWMVDPLRPIVHSGGFENNLLLIQLASGH